MNKVIFVAITAIVFVACNDDSKQQVQQLQANKWSRAFRHLIYKQPTFFLE